MELIAFVGSCSLISRTHHAQSQFWQCPLGTTTFSNGLSIVTAGSSLLRKEYLILSRYYPASLTSNNAELLPVLSLFFFWDIPPFYKVQDIIALSSERYCLTEDINIDLADCQIRPLWRRARRKSSRLLRNLPTHVLSMHKLHHFL